MKNIIITLAVLALPFFSGAQTLFFHPTNFNLSLDQEWTAVYVTDGFTSDEHTLSFNHFLVITDLNKQEGVFVFHHYVDGKIEESFTYDVTTASIFPKETGITSTEVEF